MLKTTRKIYHLRCDYCGDYFKSGQNKYKHIKMNRCPEVKKLIACGAMEPFTPTKKPKLVHERSEPIPPAPVPEM